MTSQFKAQSKNVQAFLDMHRPWEHEPTAAFDRARKVIAQTHETGDTTLSFLMMRHLQELPPEIAELTHLQRLFLTGTAITNDALRLISGLSNLRSLQLEWCNIDDDGLVHLAGLTQLQVLHLGGTHVTPAGLLHLRGMDQLQDLDLEGCAQIDDLRPLLGVGRFLDPVPEVDHGVFFDRTPAAEDGPLQGVMEVDDFLESSRELFRRLEGLAPWPEKVEGGE